MDLNTQKDNSSSSSVVSSCKVRLHSDTNVCFIPFFPAHKRSQGHGGKDGKEWSFHSRTGRNCCRKYLGVLFINEGWMESLQWCEWCTGVFSEFSSLICDCELWADTKTGERGYRWRVWASSRVSALESLKNCCSSTSKGVSIWPGASYTIPREVTARCLDRQTDGWMNRWMGGWWTDMKLHGSGGPLKN